MQIRQNLSTTPFYVAGGLVLLAGLIIFRPFTIVNAGQRGVVMRFGQVQDTVLNEGIHFLVPVVTSVKNLNVRVQKNSFESDAASKDLQKITTELAVNWHIEPSKVNRVFQNIGDEDNIISGIITPAVSEVLKAATAKKTAEEIITKRTMLKEEIDTHLATRLADYGIIVDQNNCQFAIRNSQFAIYLGTSRGAVWRGCLATKAMPRPTTIKDLVVFNQWRVQARS